MRNYLIFIQSILLGIFLAFGAHAQSIKNPGILVHAADCLLYTSPSPRDRQKSRMPSSA